MMETKKMKKIINSLIIGLFAIIISGCQTSGLSLRETGEFNYSNFIYGLYDGNRDSQEPVSKLQKPIKLAVVQIGENTPPRKVVDRLKEENNIISYVVTLPSGGEEPRYYNNENTVDLKKFDQRMDRMRRLAKDLGVDYIYLFGGSVDIGSIQSWLGFFDITIIGGFICPSYKVVAEGRASGALIDVNSSRVVFIVSSEAKKSTRASSYTVEGQEDEVLIDVRDELIRLLTERFVEKLHLDRF